MICADSLSLKFRETYQMQFTDAFVVHIMMHKMSGGLFRVVNTST